MHRLKPADAQEIIEYAKQNEIFIATQQSVGTPTYLFRDFVRAYGQMHNINGKSKS
jgi:hypothetical protein